MTKSAIFCTHMVDFCRPNHKCKMTVMWIASSLHSYVHANILIMGTYLCTYSVYAHNIEYVHQLDPDDGANTLEILPFHVDTYVRTLL